MLAHAGSRQDLLDGVLGLTWLRGLECEEIIPVYLTTCLRGGGTKAAKHAMRASGARSTDEVRSRG